MKENERFFELIEYLKVQGLLSNYVELANVLATNKAGVSDLKQGRKKISLEILNNMKLSYPAINLEWIITGKGEMINSGVPVPTINYQHIGNPYYNVDFSGSFTLVCNNQATSPDYYINFEPFNIKNGMWCNVSGKSMEPEINNGDKICIKEVKDWQTFIPFGEIYGIVTNEFRTVKRVGKSTTKGCIKLIPSNPDYDPQDLPISQVIAIFQVVGAVKMF